MADHSSLDFYFDPVSPYAWLASTQLARLAAETGAGIVIKPVLFAGFLKAHGHKGPAEIPVKRDYTFRDVLRRAARHGLTVEGPPRHPFNPLLALRTCTAIEGDSRRLQFATAIMDAAWANGRDIADAATVCALANACGLDGDWAVARAGDADIKQQLIDATQQAIDAGLFGVPSFVLGEELFWGDDRIDDLIAYAHGRRVDESHLARMLGRE